MSGRRAWVLVLLTTALLFSADSAAGAPGALDPSFGNGGVVTTWLNGNAASALLVQPDGKLVVVGTWTPTGSGQPSSIALARYLPTGVPDPGFGDDGVVTTITGDFGAVGGAGAGAAVLQPDGKIVVAGWGGAPAFSTSTQFTLVRYNPDGSLDPSFGTGGVVTTPLGDVNSAAL